MRHAESSEITLTLLHPLALQGELHSGWRQSRASKPPRYIVYWGALRNLSLPDTLLTIRRCAKASLCTPRMLVTCWSAVYADCGAEAPGTWPHVATATASLMTCSAHSSTMLTTPWNVMPCLWMRPACWTCRWLLRSCLLCHAIADRSLFSSVRKSSRRLKCS